MSITIKTVEYKKTWLTSLILWKHKTMLDFLVKEVVAINGHATIKNNNKTR